MSDMRDDFFAPEGEMYASAQAADELNAERQELTLRALYNGAMLGMPDEDVRHLLRECGLTWRDLECYVPVALRMPDQPEEPSTLELGF